MQRSALVTIAIATSASALMSGCHVKTVLDEPSASVKIARLQSVETKPGEPVPPEIARWLAVGASGLPADLLPYGLVPTGTPLPYYEATSPRFDSFHVNDIRVVDEKLARDLMKWARTAGGGDDHGSCMYPEFGFDVWNKEKRALVLVSISCGKMQVIVNGARDQENLTMTSVKAFVSLVKRAYNENIVHEPHVDESQITQERSTP